jgi:hypothetical protein
MYGLGGAIGIVYILLKLRTQLDSQALWFWGLFVAAGFVGVMAHPFLDPFGLAHICLQTLLIVGLGAIAGTWERWPALVQLLALGGLVVDLIFGVALHIAFQGRTYGEGTAADAGILPGGPSPETSPGQSNWYERTNRHFLFLGDTIGAFRWVVVAGLAIGAFYVLRGMVRSARQPAPSAPEPAAATPGPAQVTA